MNLIYKLQSHRAVRFHPTQQYCFIRRSGTILPTLSDNYKNFLQSKKDLIISAFIKGGSHNLRTLKFVLDIYQKYIIYLNLVKRKNTMMGLLIGFYTLQLFIQSSISRVERKRILIS